MNKAHHFFLQLDPKDFLTGVNVVFSLHEAEENLLPQISVEPLGNGNFLKLFPFLLGNGEFEGVFLLTFTLKGLLRVKIGLKPLEIGEIGIIALVPAWRELFSLKF